MRNALWLLIPVFVLSACGTQPSEACRDLVTAFGNTAERCGFDRDLNESEFESAATMDMGCGQTDDIRDFSDFYDVCVPFFENLTCAEFDSTSLSLPAECVDQLLFRVR